MTGLLREMGLSELEATIYVWLLQNKRSTGYRISGEIGKPVANTYKALKSLEGKGAVISDNTTSKTVFEAVPAGQYLNKLEREFQRQRDRIVNEVNKLDVNQSIDGIYELQSLDLAYEKAIGMIESAEEQLLIDCFPAPLSVLDEHIRKKGSSETVVILKNYCERQFDNVRQIRALNKAFVLEALEGHWMVLVKDAVESLIALISSDGHELIHSVWIKDPFISLILYNGTLNEANLTELYPYVFGTGDEKERLDGIRSSIVSYHSNFEFFIKAKKNLLGRKR